MRDALAALNEELEREWGVDARRRGPASTPARSSPATRRAGRRSSPATRSTSPRGSSRRRRPGEILIGDATHRLVRDAVEAEPVEPLDAEGQGGAGRRVAAADGRGEARRARAAPRLADGRARPAARAARTALRRGRRRTGRVPAVTVFGPAGVGKSRLVQEFVASVAAERTVLHGRCLPYGEGITFWPLAEMAMQAAGIADDDPPERARAKIARAARGHTGRRDRRRACRGLLGLGRLGRRRRPSGRSAGSSRRSASERPLVAVFDDIHWAEPTFLDLLEHLADWSRDSRSCWSAWRARSCSRRARVGRGQAQRDRRPRSSRSPSDEAAR